MSASVVTMAPHYTHASLQGAVQRWLGEYQGTAVEYAQQGYDQIQEYVKTNFNDYVEANNLTQVRCVLLLPNYCSFLVVRGGRRRGSCLHLVALQRL